MEIIDKARFTDKSYKRQIDFWTSHLKQFQHGFSFNQIERVESHRPATLRTIQLKVTRSNVALLQALAKQNDAAMFVLLVSAWGMVLKKCTQQKNILIDSPLFQVNDEKQYNSHIPLFLQVDPAQSIQEYLTAVQTSVKASYLNQYYPLSLLEDSRSFPVFKTNVLISYAPIHKETKISPHHDLCILLEKEGEEINVLLSYRATSFETSFILRLETYLNNVIAYYGQSECALKSIQVLGEDEKQILIKGLNCSKREFADPKTIHQIFEEQAARTPNAVALVIEAEELTYAELNKLANKLANCLLSRYKVRPSQIVALMAERSSSWVIGLLGILKSGAAYLPVDPAYPDERIAWILQDAKPAVLVADAHALPALRHYSSGSTFRIDKELKDLEDDTSVQSLVTSDALAYVIYTSGSTGLPKGVMVNHKGVVNMSVDQVRQFGISPNDRVLQFASLSFDASVSEIAMAFFSGAALVMVDSATIRSLQAMTAFIKRQHITVATFPPSYMRAFREDELNTLKVIITAGEAADAEKLMACSSFARCFNAYGPTECSVCVSIHPVVVTGSKHTSIPIGKPIANLSAYILDDNMELVPRGVKGELYVAGPGVATGYLGDSAKTAEKFVANPYPGGKLLYRTGDLVRWNENGDLEFFGRCDEQVKIRGFRIEPGEVAAVLKRHEAVQDAFVMKDPVQETLLAIVIPQTEKAAPIVKTIRKKAQVSESVEPNGLSIKNETSNAEESVEKNAVDHDGGMSMTWTSEESLIADSMRLLKTALPEHMLPSSILLVDYFPLTPNGKVDKKALLLRAEALREQPKNYKAPSNEKEQLIASIWGNLLNTKKISVTDNFFALGGDSIKGIQIVSRIYKAGYKATLQDLFQYPTIETFSERVQHGLEAIDQAAVVGPVPLSPIQSFFFEKSLRQPHHFNQAVLLHTQERLPQEMLQIMFGKIQAHHDALRLTFTTSEGNVYAVNRDVQLPLDLQSFDWRNDSLDVHVHRLEEEAEKLQRSIDLSSGPLMKVAHFQLQDGDRLLIIIHHLVIDTVSWRILSEDIESLYQQYKMGVTLSMPPKTHSFKTWSEGIAAYAASPSFQEEAAYWKRITETPAMKWKKEREGTNTHQDQASLSFSLTPASTQRLLTAVPAAFHTEINDILLTALGLSIAKQWGEEKIHINLEGHGREAILSSVNISRTVGWFTCDYPIVLDFTQHSDLALQLKQVKEYLRNIPNKGIGYGIWKYLTPDGRDSQPLRPPVSFNYLGQFDSDLQQLSFTFAKESYGRTQSAQEERWSELDFSGVIAGDQLSVSLTFSSSQFTAEKMQSLLDTYQKNLEMIIDFCASRDKETFTPSDFAFKGLSIANVEKLTATYDVEDIYTLSPMQEGMLFQALYEPNSSAYFDQTSYRLTGNLDPILVEQSLNDLVQRHDVLRTAFVQGLPGIKPIQVVLKSKKINFNYLDLKSLRVEDAEHQINQFKVEDRQRGFNFDEGSLLRISLFQLADDAYEFIWSHHHILMDGWCIRILIAEFMELYNSHQLKRAHGLLPVKPYRTYIQWLGIQSQEALKAYWANYLSGYSTVACVPRMQSLTIERTTDKNTQYFYGFSKEKTDSILTLAAKNNLTVNTILQTIWGITLAKYNHRHDVVFGAVVSGRPSQIAGIESMIGLFINAIPVRIRFQEEDTFTELIRNVQKEAINSEPYHYCPLVEIQSVSPLKKNLIDHLLTFENYPIAEEIEGIVEESAKIEGGVQLEVSNIEVHDQNHYDFNILFGLGTQLLLKLEYTTAYSSEFIEQIAQHFDYVLMQVTENPAIRMGELQITSPQERQTILENFSGIKIAHSSSATIVSLFEQQVEQTPHAMALVFGDVRLTYWELNERANVLAHYLRGTCSVDRNVWVAILLERSELYLISILAVLKAGGGYVPINPTYPRERTQFMLDDIRPRVLLTHSNYLGDLSYFDGELFAADIQLDTLEQRTANPEHINVPSDFAYIMYTSGSTGLAKGVVVPHRGVIRLARNTNYIKLHPELKLIQTGAPSFDATTFEIWGMLLNGGQLHLLSQAQLMDTDVLGKAVVGQGITTLWLTSSWFNKLVDMDVSLFSGLKQLLVGGEKLSPIHINKVKRLFPYLTIINGYGPTENTTFSICHTIVEEHNASIPLGKPISNSYVYILNDNKEPVPVGVEGEIYVGGEGLALGYLNQPELTAEKFMADPFRSTEKIYRTGDIGKWLPDGNVEFVGRKDDQIKLRGYRIEPNEIAHTIRHHSGVQDAIVQVTNLGQPDAELICVVIPHPERAFTLNRLARLRRERGSLLTRILPNNLIVAHNNISETGFLYTEIFEDHTYHKNGIELKEGDVVFDVGANIGMFSLYVALHYPNTKIYSLEPVKPTYETLRANSMLYPVSIKPIHCGASSQTQTVQFTHYPFNTVMSGRYGDDSSVDKEILRGYFGKQQEGDTDKATTEQIDEMLDERMKAEYYDCQLRRISDIIREEGVTKIDLLKIDVEKSELDALMGIDKEHWNIIQQVSIEIHDINGQLEKIKSLMEENGFSYHVEQEDILTNTHLYNIYATKLKKSTRKETGLPERSKDAYEWLIPEVFLKALKEHCQQKLPDYMVPSRFYMVDQFPLTDNGKVDMKKLFAMDSMSTDKTVAHEGPMNSIEEALLAVWKEVLGREDIGTTDNFFEIGGHSLKAIQVISHVAKQLNTKLELGAIFSKPTIRELAVELQRSNVTALQEIPKLKEQPNYALSYAQRRLWLICQNEKENVAYTMPGAVRLSGDLDREAFSKAFNVLVERHESLRTTFSLISGEPQQIIHQRSELSGLEVMFTDLRQEENCEELVRATIESAVSTPFQLEKGPLIQVRLLQEQDMQHTLVFTMHHIISDGRSIDVLLHDFLTAYNAFSLGKENPLTPLPIQYKDFAAWHNASISANEVQSHRKFWLETLSGELPVLSMATDFPRPTIKTATGKLVRFTLGSTLCQQLKAYAQESGSSVYILLQATIKAWLHYYTKQRDIIIGSPVSGREQAALNDQIGYYLNTMVIRTRFTPTQSFHTLLEQVKQDTAKVFMHQHYPFDLLVEDLHIKMDRSRNILFDVGFNLNMQNEVSLHEEHAFQQITVTNIPIGFGTTKTDLWFNAHDKMDELGFTVEYNTDLFREATIETMVSNYLFLLEAIAANKAITLVELNEQIQQNEMLYIRSKQEKASSSGFAQLMNTSATGIKQV